MQKARRHTTSVLRPLVGVRFQELFHSLIQGAFHLSLTVLVRYRSLRSIQPYRMVPADSYRISRVPHYSGYSLIYKAYVYGTITPYGSTFQLILLQFIYRCVSPTTPTLPKQQWFGLFPFRSPLLRESLLFSSPAGTKMFQFPAFASSKLDT